MLIFWFGLLIMAGGLGAVAYLLLNEKKQEQGETVPEPIAVKPQLTIQGFLQRLNLGGSKEQPALAEPQVKPSRFDFLKTLNSLTKKKSPSIEKISFPDASENKNSPAGTASLRLNEDRFANPAQPAPATVSQPKNQPPSDEVDMIIRAEELEKELKHTQERYAQLDKMFQEKSIELEKSEKNLAVELKTHKEFNKIKDILEKEIKETKDKSRNLEIAVASAQTEGQSFLKRVNQLEEKIKKVEKEVREKEEEIRQVQQTAELQKTKAADLEAKLKKSEETVQEKMNKINDLVGHLQDHKPAAEAAPAIAEEPKSQPAIVEEKPVIPEAPVSAKPPETIIPITDITQKPAELASLSAENTKEGGTEAVPPQTDAVVSLEATTTEPTTAPSEPDQKQKTIDALKDTFKEAFAVSPETSNEVSSALPEDQQNEPPNADNTPPEEELPPPKGVPVADLLNLIKPPESNQDNPNQDAKEVHLMPDILSEPQKTEDTPPKPPSNSESDTPAQEK